MPVERRPAAARIAHVRNRRPRKIQRVAAAIDGDFDDVGVLQLSRIGDPVIQRRDIDVRIGGERRDRFVDRPRVDQRLVALYADNDVAVERRRHFRDAVGAARMVGARQTHLATESADGGRDAQIVGGDDDARHQTRLRRPPVDVFDHRTTVDVGERFSGEPCRAESGGDDGDRLERRMIDRSASRRGVHDEFYYNFSLPSAKWSTMPGGH